ncbi:zinc-dependent metalloprotease [Actinocatenispora rupis]|uniref:Hydrolase n=1 Tax=Actinocatenispora rupis TaxID=519421 RepID=A0A8J3NDI2_9ACTN|nr:zinc-dependent metalloprotease [Actinocatenispora rupis]GID15081.1 hypothetical protein Aru02nite_59700 [Actinocatenispora rupis]
MTQFVDWDLAVATAGTISKAGPRVSYDEAAEVVGELRRLTDEAAGHVVRTTGLDSKVSHPPVRVVDRADWASTNLYGLRDVMTPLMERALAGREPSALAQSVGSRLTGVQAGTVLGYLSGKVLGQYEVFSGEPGNLLLVAPNIVEVERRLGAEPHDFRLWVCLHEVTHRTQFTAVPWLRQYFMDQVGEFVDAARADSEQLVDRIRRGVASLADAVRSPESRASVLDLVQTPAQREVVDRLTALMTLLEGHADYVMDAVGPRVVPSVEEIRSKFNRRREAANPVERVIRKLLGIDAKMRQYAEGNKFVTALVDRVGMDGFNRIWSSADTLPLLAEITDPDAWLRRVHGADA